MFTLEDICEQTFVAGPHQDFMVCHVLIDAICPKIDDKQRHCILHVPDFAVRVLPSKASRNKIEIGKGHISITHDTLSRKKCTIFEQHTVCTACPLINTDLSNLCIK